MSQRVRGGLMRALLVTCLAVGVSVATAGVAAAEPAAATGSSTEHFELPEGTPTPGPGFAVDSAFRVVAGVQIYDCVANPDGTGTWSTPRSTPAALLQAYDRGGFIHHFGGPRWMARDGSTVVGAVAQSVPQDGTIPWLLLDVTAHENSAPGKQLDDVTHISRVNTSGGVGPTGPCSPGEQCAVPYEADYVFWTKEA